MIDDFQQHIYVTAIYLRGIKACNHITWDSLLVLTIVHHAYLRHTAWLAVGASTLITTSKRGVQDTFSVTHSTKDSSTLYWQFTVPGASQPTLAFRERANMQP